MVISNHRTCESAQADGEDHPEELSKPPLKRLKHPEPPASRTSHAPSPISSHHRTADSPPSPRPPPRDSPHPQALPDDDSSHPSHNLSHPHQPAMDPMLAAMLRGAVDPILPATGAAGSARQAPAQRAPAAEQPAASLASMPPPGSQSSLGGEPPVDDAPPAADPTDTGTTQRAQRAEHSSGAGSPGGEGPRPKLSLRERMRLIKERQAQGAQP